VAYRPSNGGNFGTLARDSAARGEERRINREPARACGIKELADAILQCHGDTGLEHLRDVGVSLAQGLEIGRHGAVRHPIEPLGIDAVPLETMLQAQSWVGTSDMAANLSRGRSANVHVGRPALPMRKKRILCHDFAETNEGRMRVLVADLHYTRWTTP